MREATLVLLFRGTDGEREVLLAMKKRGFGVGKWNGPGGKVKTSEGETPLQAIIRETKEEVGLDLLNAAERGHFIFTFPHNHELDLDCYLFFATNFSGELLESEEMAPRWFKISEIPYDEMWDGDKIWLPRALELKPAAKLEGKFEFDTDNKVLSNELIEISIE